jgi:two-component system chemotaxis response regulator CheB
MMAMVQAPIQVLVVDDSAFMRRVITDFINEEPDMRVVDVARNAAQALEKIKRRQPDVVTLDVELPDMNGLEVLRRVMAEHPVPVIMLSGLTRKGTQAAIEAMSLGAVDFVTKPSGTISLDLYKVKEELKAKIRAAHRVSVRMPALDGLHPVPWTPSEDAALAGVHRKKIVCIGTSTGGPRSLQAVVPRLPKALSAPVLIVQHMPPVFTASLAERLNQLSEVTVREAVNGEVLRDGTVYIAPGGRHMRVRKVGRALALEISDGPPIRGLKPCFDLLLESLAEIGEQDIVATVMTGMGNDGAEGLSAIKRTCRVHAIAESEETSVIFGMPRAAIETGLVDEVLPLEKIAPAIVKQICS